MYQKVNLNSLNINRASQVQVWKRHSSEERDKMLGMQEEGRTCEIIVVSLWEASEKSWRYQVLQLRTSKTQDPAVFVLLRDCS
jgi:hypothetical protein